MKKQFLVIILMYSFVLGFSQKSKTDSLLLKIQSSSGIERGKALNAAAFLFRLNNPDTAIILARQGLQIAKITREQDVTANSLGLIAESFSYLSQFDSSAQYYLNAITIAEKSKNLKKLASYNNGLGGIFYQLGDFEKAISYMKIAADIKLRSNDILYYAVINGNIAAVLQRLGKYKEAIAILRDSELKVKTFDNIEILANLYNSLGSAYLLESKFKNLDSAEYYYGKNISLITKPEHEAFRLSNHKYK